LVVFSQGLSPNARLALSAAKVFDEVVVFTSAATDRVLAASGRADTLVIRHGPPTESGTLLRIVGPVAASLAAAMIAGRWLGRPPRLIEAEARAALAAVEARTRAADGCEVRAEPLSLARQRIGIVVTSELVDISRCLAWKWLEGLRVAEPPIWDVLQIVHGPFQSFYDERIVLIMLEDPQSQALFRRLESILVPSRHIVLRIASTVPGPLRLLDFDAAFNRLLLPTLDLSFVDPTRWPGQSRDGALYEIDDWSQAPPAPSRHTIKPQNDSKQ
jgi:hypothetical protein